MDFFQQPACEGGSLTAKDHELPRPLKRAKESYGVVTVQQASFPAIDCNQNGSNLAITQSVPFSTAQNGRTNQPMTSTSGRGNTESTVMFLELFPALQSDLSKQKDEMDQLIKIQSETTRQHLEENRRAHVKAMLAIIERGVNIRMKAKDEELQKARIRNGELDESLKQWQESAQKWQQYAAKTEIMAWDLRSKWETAVRILDQQRSKEGWGETPEVEDAASSSCPPRHDDKHKLQFRDDVEPTTTAISTCNLCRKSQACILLLPCRHLCLCKACEALVDVCPICQSVKSASIQVYLQ